MTRIFTFFSLVCFSAVLFADNYVLDSADVERDGDVYRYVFTYNSDNKLNENYIYKKAAADFVKYAKEQYTFATTQTKVLTYTWDENGETPWKQEIFTYNSTGELLLQTDSAEYSEGAFVSKRRQEYEYNADNKVSQHTVYAYNESTKALQYEQQHQYTYTAGLLTKVIVRTGEGLSLNSLYEYSYSNDTLVKMVESKWNMETTKWVLSCTSTYEYGDGTMTITKASELKDWDDKITTIRSVYTYDAQGREVSVLSTKNSHDEGESSTEWTNFQRKISMYTTAGDISSVQLDEWNTGSWSEIEKQTYSYADQLTLAEVLGAQSAVENALRHNESFVGMLSGYERCVNKIRTRYEKLYYSIPGGSAVSNIVASTIFALNGRVYAQEPIRIYSISGVDVTAQNGNLNGVYVVKTAQQTYKLLVR